MRKVTALTLLNEKLWVCFWQRTKQFQRNYSALHRDGFVHAPESSLVPILLRSCSQELAEQIMGGAVFLDRDGVLNEDLGYVHRPSDWIWIEGAREAVAKIVSTGRHCVVVTNQSGVSRGFFQEADVEFLHRWVNSQLGGAIDAFYYCPDLDEESPCRKPNPGLILQAVADLRLDLSQSFLIGDKPTDIEAARRAGIPGFLFKGGNLDEFVSQILLHCSP